MKAVNSYEMFDTPSEHLDTDIQADEAAEMLTAHQRQLVQDNFDLVHAVASFMIYCEGLRLDFDDAIGYGSIGLCKAIQRFDPSKGVSLGTYARRRIRGAILDGIRSFDKINRNTGFPNSISVLNGNLGISMDRPLGEHGFTLAHTFADASLTAEEQYVADDERKERVALAHKLVSGLNEIEKTVVIGLARGRKQVDIARELSVTESRISQIKSKAYKKAKDRNGSSPLQRKRERDDRYVNPTDVPAIFAIGALISKIRATQTLIDANESLNEPDSQHIDGLRLRLAQLTYSLVSIPQVKNAR